MKLKGKNERIKRLLAKKCFFPSVKNPNPKLEYLDIKQFMQTLSDLAEENNVLISLALFNGSVQIRTMNLDAIEPFRYFKLPFEEFFEPDEIEKGETK